MHMTTCCYPKIHPCCCSMVQGNRPRHQGVLLGDGQVEARHRNRRAAQCLIQRVEVRPAAQFLVPLHILQRHALRAWHKAGPNFCHRHRAKDLPDDCPACGASRIVESACLLGSLFGGFPWTLASCSDIRRNIVCVRSWSWSARQLRVEAQNKPRVRRPEVFGPGLGADIGVHLGSSSEVGRDISQGERWHHGFLWSVEWRAEGDWRGWNAWPNIYLRPLLLRQSRVVSIMEQLIGNTQLAILTYQMQE